MHIWIYRVERFPQRQLSQRHQNIPVATGVYCFTVCIPHYGNTIVSGFIPLPDIYFKANTGRWGNAISMLGQHWICWPNIKTELAQFPDSNLGLDKTRDPETHTLTQDWINVGPPSTTPGQHWTNIGSTSRVCRKMSALVVKPHHN